MTIQERLIRAEIELEDCKSRLMGLEKLMSKMVAIAAIWTLAINGSLNSETIGKIYGQAIGEILKTLSKL